MRTTAIRPFFLSGLLALSLLTAFGLSKTTLSKPGRDAFGFLRYIVNPSPKKPVHKLPILAVDRYKFKLPTRPVEVLSLPDSGRQWVDSVFATLTPEQKIGQFFMVAAYSNRGENHNQYIDHLIQSNAIGGLIFFQGGPYRQAKLTNRYQALSKVPLLIGIDGEWGLGMRLDSTTEFPRQMSLGAIRDNDVIFRMGAEIGRQCQRLGIHINFAPVSDINTNPANPVIGTRSFGESRENVALKASAYMRGLQQTHVIATAKHFPGHGDTSSDSHHTLPTVSRSSEQMRDVDLYPFRQLIADSLMGIVTGHLHVPVMDNTPALAATLSEKIVTEILKKELGFRGLVFTDAMNMGGLSQSPKAMDINLRALMAGNDILLYPENVQQAALHILAAVQTGIITQEFVNEKVRKILRAKYWAGLSRAKPIDLANLGTDLNGSEADQINQEICEQSVTVAQNQGSLLPFGALDSLRLVSIAIGASEGNVFQKTLNQYAPFETVAVREKPVSEADITRILAQIGNANTAVVSYHRLSESASRKFGIPKASTDLITRLKQRGLTVAVAAFGSPYSLPQFAAADAIVCGYQDIDGMQRVVPQVLFGALASRGVLPVSTGAFKAGAGILLNPAGRLSAGSPESVGMKSSVLAQIDAIAQAGVRGRAVPGCQVLVARKGKVVYNKNFGALTYAAGAEKVTDETLYDLASLTKVLATLQSVMVLYDRKQLDLAQKASFYLPELRGTNKQNFTVQDLLWHQSGMVSGYAATWDRTRSPGGGLKAQYYGAVADSLHTLQIAPTLWGVPALRDSVWKWVVFSSPLSRKIDASGQPGYLYSDLNFLTLQKIVERISKQPLDEFVTKNIYKPLGLHQLGFTPLQRLNDPHCAPTEQDTYYRNQLLVGTVHDQMAAVQGGVSGHAGLFSNAHDVAVMLQMNLQKGQYGEQRILNPMTVPYFTQSLSNRSFRALGWDKPDPGTVSSSYRALQASPRSFGHTGFTGNMVWVDPDQDLVFVFLSNRVYPSAGNNAINTTKLRRRIHELVYSAIQ